MKPFEFGGIKIFQGDCRDVLAALEPQSAQTCVTSPPYWGLRDYNIPPRVWGGEKDCEHEWGDEQRPGNYNWADKIVAEGNLDRGHQKAVMRTRNAFCQKCGAWLGNLGLEPVPDCGRPFMELRCDLNDAERSYVAQRLQALGLLGVLPYGMGRTTIRHCRLRSEASETVPMPERDGHAASLSSFHSPGTSSYRDQEPPSEMPYSEDSCNQHSERENGRLSNSGGADQLNGHSSGADNLPTSPQVRSPSCENQKAFGQAASEQSSPFSSEGKELQDLSACHDVTQKSSVSLPPSLQDSTSSSAKSSGKKSSRTRVRPRRNDARNDCSVESSVLACWIIPDDLRRFYRPKLCSGCFVCHIVEVFEAVRRVLRDDGTLWLNMGDCYATGAGKVGECPGGGQQGERWKGNRGTHNGNNSGKAAYRLDKVGPMTQPNRMPIAGLKPKDLVGIPWRCAFALQAAGWWLRMDIIWSKPNGMCESVEDRPTKSHEYIFLMAKSERYYYDFEAIKEPAVGQNSHDLTGSGYSAPGQTPQQGNRKDIPGPTYSRHRSSVQGGQDLRANPTGMRNRRSVWHVPTAPFRGAHFATFPPKLIEPCILAGCPEGGVVLDPFTGAGTTAMVARDLGRKFVGAELNPEYIEIAKRRIGKQEALF